MMPSPEEILAAARASGKDDLDLEIAALLREHPELAADFEAMRHADLIATAAMAEIEVPDGLEDQLVSLLKKTRLAGDVPKPGVETASTLAFPHRDVSRRNWLAGAAAVALGAGGGYWFLRQQSRPSFDTLLAQLARISREGVTLSLMSMDRTEVVKWLTSRDAPRANKLPSGLDELPRKGCHIYLIDGRRVSLECFLLPEMRELHVFTTPAGGFKDLPPDGAEPILRTIDGLTAALWRREGEVMALLTGQPESAVRPVLLGA